MKAAWNNEVIAESDATIIVENNYYFPVDAVKKDFLRASTTHTACPWKGVASYYSLHVNNNQENPDAAWYYPNPKPAAENIKNYIAFWKGVVISN